MITIEQGMKLSSIIDKMDIKVTNPKGNEMEVGADLITQVLKKAHLASDEIYDFVADVKGISLQDAKKVDIVEFATDLFSEKAVTRFFGSVLKSQGQESLSS